MPDKDEIQRVVDALWEVYDIRSQCLGNTEIIRRITDLAKSMAAEDTGPSVHGGIRKTAANAITRAYLNADLEDL